MNQPWEDEKVIFSPLLEELTEGEKSQSMIAKAVNRQQWLSALTDIIWHVKWTMNGLMPVRPIVIFKKAFPLQAGETILLDCSQEP
jgi:hypothetical protein